MMSRMVLATLVLSLLTLTPAAAHGQQSGPPAAHRQVVSANPFGLLLGWFNAEYERQVSESVTAGIGASTFDWGGNDGFNDDDDRYVNGDVFVRYYPSGRPLEGLALGVKAGLTKGGSDSARFGVGLDTNWSWLLGKRDNVYVGLGFGLKRLVGADSDYPVIIPTIRIINLGVAF
jgi:hypothetical protein